jgi:hypothetical protein
MVTLGWAAADILARRLAARLQRKPAADPPAPDLSEWATGAMASITGLKFDGQRAVDAAWAAEPKRRPYAPKVQVLEVVAVEFNRGKGVVSDPVRAVLGYYGRDGHLLAEHDDWAENHPIDLRAAAQRALEAASATGNEPLTWANGVGVGVATMQREVDRLLRG